MEKKYLIESARITDAYAQMCAKSAEQKKTINESCSDGLPTKHKVPAKTGSKLGRRDMLPFEKRDAKPSKEHNIPMKKTFGNGVVSKNVKTPVSSKSTTIGSSKTGSKLGVRSMLPFEKRDAKPTSVGHVGSVKKVSCVKGIKESEDFEMKVIDVDNVGTEDTTEETSSKCCEECKEILSLVKDTFAQIYDNLSDDDKALVDEVTAQIDEHTSEDDDDDDESADEDGDEEAEDSDTDIDDEANESVVNEGAKKEAAKALFKGMGKEIVNVAIGSEKAALLRLSKLARKGAKPAEIIAAAKEAIAKGAKGKLITEIANGTEASVTKKLLNPLMKANLKVQAASKEFGGVAGAIAKHPKTASTFGAGGLGLAGYGTAKMLGGDDHEPVSVVSDDNAKNAAGDSTSKTAASTPSGTSATNGLTDEQMAVLKEMIQQQLDAKKAAAPSETEKLRDAIKGDEKEKKEETGKSSSFGETLGNNIGGFVGSLGKGIGDGVSGLAKGATDVLAAPFRAVGIGK